jgi:hypothetical protein
MKEFKEESNAIQTRHHHELEQEKQNVAAVRSELGEKVERQGVELTSKDRQVTSLEQ